MPFQPVPDTAKVAVVATYLVSDVVNTFHFKRSGSWGASELEDLVGAVAAAWVASVMPSLSANMALRRIESRGLRSDGDVAVEFVFSPVVSGGRGGDSLPGSIAFAVTHLTGLAGRSYRGRTFFGGLAEADVSGDLLDAGRADALRNGLESVRQQASAQGWTMVVVSRTNNRTPRAQGLTIPVTGFRWRDRIVDSQRRRLTGRGS